MRRAAVRAVVFDMDGLMLDTERLYRSAWRRAAQDFGHAIDDELYQRLIGRSTREAARVLAEIFGAGFPRREFHERWIARWREEVDRVGIAAKPGLEQTLAAVESLGLKKAVATSTERGDAIFTLRHAAIEERFAAIVTGDQVEQGKPAPDIFLAAAQALAVAPAACLAFEDSDAGVAAASAAGMIVAMVPDMVPPSDASRAAADHLLRSLEEAPALIRSLS